MIQCTVNEVINVLRIGGAVLYAACEREHGCTLAEYMEQYRDMGRMSLRRAQYKAAISGNTTMMRWLGIQYLEQSPDVVVMHKVQNGPAAPAEDAQAVAPTPAGFAIRGLNAPAETPAEESPADPNTIPTTGRTVG